jgi:SAM-dependent methyltransferase
VSNPRPATAYWDDRYRRQGVAVPDESEPCARAALAHFGDLRGKRLLDLGCGPGDYSLFFAERGAEVTAIDYSAVAIDQLQAVCRDGGIENVHPVVADAFDIERLGPFDLVFGKWILHHLEPFTDFARTLRASLVDDGLGFFYENNGLSGALLWARAHLAGRYGIPKFGDNEEFPLTPDEIDELRRYFDVEVDVAETYLAQLGSQYLLRSRCMGAAARADGVVHTRFPRLRRYSYRQNLLLRARPAG